MVQESGTFCPSKGHGLLISAWFVGRGLVEIGVLSERDRLNGKWGLNFGTGVE
jgi:hypothetical protein